MKKSNALIPSVIVGIIVVLSACTGSSTKSKKAANNANASNKISETIYPSDIIPDINLWKITLPIDSLGNDNSDIANVDDRNKYAYEIFGKGLINFEYKPYFEVRDNEVVFRGHCAGATTTGSKYPRCELRQLIDGGNNYWSVNDYQYLETELRVTQTPIIKPEVCMVQIHGPNDEPLRLQYNLKKGLILIYNEKNKIKINDSVPYVLGQKLRVTVTVDKGDITCAILNLDNKKAFSKTWTSSDKTGYFKVGCYTQSSKFLSQFKKNKEDEPKRSYGEVTVSKLKFTLTYNK